MSGRRAGRGAVAVACLVAVGLVSGACRSSGGVAEVPSAVPPTSTTTTTLPPTTVTTILTTTASSGDPGVLPQTHDRPSDSDPAFLAGAQRLWQAIVADDPSIAMSFFFPLTAYQQVKAIADPAHDYQTRLIANYEDDIHALHRMLGASAASARYGGIAVPAFQARWVNPGEEFNKLGYWRVYDSALRYDLAGQSHSLLVTSLISWRGEWYVVHLRSIR